MAFNTDNFNRPNGALGPNWTPIENTTPVILSNGFTNGTGTSDNNSPNSTANTGSAYWNATLFPPNQFAQVTIQTVGSTGTDCAPGCIVRGSSDGTIAGQNWYALFAGPNTTGTFANYQLEVWKMVSGTAIFLGQSSFAPTISPGDVLRLEIFGSNLTAYYNGTLLFQKTDTDIASGQPGVIVALGSPGTDHPSNTTQGGSWVAGDLNNVLAADNFIRANANPMSGNWSTVTGVSPLKISSNTVLPTAANVNGYELYNGATWPNDQWGQTSLQASDGSTTFQGIVLRGTTSNQTAYAGFAKTTYGSSNTIFILKYINGVQTILTSGSFVTHQSDVIYFEVQGTNLKLKQNGTIILTATDSSISSGSAGIFVQSAVAGSVTLFEGGNFPIPAITQEGAFIVGF